MPPRARRVLLKAVADSTSAEGENNGATTTTTNDRQTRRKHTLTSAQPSTSTSSDTPAASVPPRPPPTKRARNEGPAHARPMQLNLMSSGGSAQQGQPTVVDNRIKGKDTLLKRTASFYPGCHGTQNTVPGANSRSHIQFNVAKEEDPFVSDGNNSDVENEAEWFDEPQVEDVAQKSTSKTSQAIAIERPSWDDPVGAVGPSISVASVTQGSGGNATSHESGSSGSSGVDNSSAPNNLWPSDTELVLFPGTNKILLTLQSPLMRSVFQETFEHLQVSLLFIHAFPDPIVSRSMTGEALIIATTNHLPRSSNIQAWLWGDEEYMSKMCHLPRSRIALFRGEVKERCAAMIQLSFFSAGNAASITRLVEKQLSNYYYTYPTAQMHDPINTLPLRTRPYHNARIISVIRDLYFSGGSNSYAYRFDFHFPTHRTDDGSERHEVPIPMVALVATALYAAIHEWHAGRHHPMDFSANAYLDVYQGHIDTFHYIRETRLRAFHTMMSDIYSKASVMEATTAVPVADLNIEELED